MELLSIRKLYPEASITSSVHLMIFFFLYAQYIHILSIEENLKVSVETQIVY